MTKALSIERPLQVHFQEFIEPGTAWHSINCCSQAKRDVKHHQLALETARQEEPLLETGQESDGAGAAEEWEANENEGHADGASNTPDECQEDEGNDEEQEDEGQDEDQDEGQEGDDQEDESHEVEEHDGQEIKDQRRTSGSDAKLVKARASCAFVPVMLFGSNRSCLRHPPPPSPFDRRGDRQSGGRRADR